MAEVKELQELLTIAKDDLLYLLLETKAEKEKLNASGLAALMYLRDIYNIEKVDKDFIRISDYLERYENEIK